MILYHGSSVKVLEPRLLEKQRRLDFGSGFYTTSDLNQAARWAQRTAKRLRQSDAFVTVYEMIDVALYELRVLRFERPDSQWLEFVVANRRGIFIPDNWDIISGPAANDQTSSVIDLYEQGMYDEPEAIRRLLPQKLKDQYTFKTEAAVRLLRCKEAFQV